MPHPIFEISELTQVIIDYCLPRNTSAKPIAAVVL
jgi:hypothetical protein